MRPARSLELTATEPLLARLCANVEFTETCWQWQRCPGVKYPVISLNGESIFAHRFSYALLVGPLPTNRVIDHLCRNTRCVNPDHLELVSNAENILRGTGFSAINARKTHCPQGHELAGENLYVSPGGGRFCRACYKANRWRRRGWTGRRKTHCKRGHEYTPENTAFWGGGRVCRICDRDRVRCLRKKYSTHARLKEE